MRVHGANLQLSPLPSSLGVSGHPALALVSRQDVQLVLQPVAKLRRLMLLSLVQVDLRKICMKKSLKKIKLSLTDCFWSISAIVCSYCSPSIAIFRR